MQKTKNYIQYTEVSYTGRELLKEYSLDEEGIWEVRGEDPNCDIQGSHHNPYIATFDGRLEDVITLAVELPNFWQWGGGGVIKKITIAKIDSNASARIADIREKLKDLEDWKAKLEADLIKLGAK